LRIGINLGDLIVEGRDLYGDGINIAARLEQLADPGGVCISANAFEHVQAKVEGDFEDIGDQQLKNIGRAVRVWRWTGTPKRTPGATPGPPRPVAMQGKPSIAVLPFENMSDRQDCEYLAHGLTEDVITLLARVPGFLVIARNSSFAYKGRTPDVREVGRDLDVRYVVQGTLRPTGSKLRIAVHLLEARTGVHLWSGRFDRPAEELEELQDQITLGIVTRLEPELAKAEIEHIKRRPPGNLDAWAHYQRASALLSLKGWHRETFEEAAQLLRTTIVLDPEFALAHAYLSLVLALGHMFGLVPPGTDPEREAVQEAERAIQIDGRDPAVLGFAGCALCDIGQTQRGIEILERAVGSDSSNAQAWVALGVTLIRTGKPRRGIEMLRHGMRISPLDNRLAYWGTNLAYALFRSGEIEAAEEQAQLACRRDDKLYFARVVLAVILAHRRRLSEARRAIEEALRVRPDLRAEDIRSLVGRRGVRILEQAGLLP
ncbi:MAG: adenylate/guanylate cyclase domain-containing protein, partial [Geminicoccales bacterium]